MELRADIRAMLRDFGVDVVFGGEPYPKVGVFSTASSLVELEGLRAQGITATLVTEEGTLPAGEDDTLTIGGTSYRVRSVDPMDDGLLEQFALAET